MKSQIDHPLIHTRPLWIAILVAFGALLQPSSAAPPTTIPSNSNYTAHPAWNKACEERVAAIKGQQCDMIFIGDSITQNFIEKPTPTWNSVGDEIWEKYYANRHALNFGVGSDTTQNVLWRLEHMEIKNLKPKVAVVLIGTNNFRDRPEDIAAGVKAVIDKTQMIFPNAKIILVSILPNARAAEKMANANKLIEPLANNQTVFYFDLASKMPSVGSSWQGLGKDRIHLLPEGYELWAASMEPLLLKLLTTLN